MTISAFSDLAFHLLRQRQVTQTRAQLEQAGQELTTGQSADIRSATGGDLSKLFSIDRSLAKLAQRTTNLTLADGRASVTQAKLKTLQDISSDTGTNLQIAVDRGDMVAARTYATDSAQKLQQVVSSLNATYQGKSLFSGAAENIQALASSDSLISDIDAIITASASANDAITAIDAYFFDPGAGFETNMYLGATENAPEVETADGASVNLSVRADDMSIREVLRGLAIAAAVANGAADNNLDDQKVLLREAGASMVNAKEGVIQLGADLGMVQNQISASMETIDNDVFELETARNAIAGVDPYEAASQFSALESQLQSMYTVTARISSLNLTNFLR